VGRIRTSWLIHGFALLHAAVTVLCLLAGVKDSMILTVLTMTMTVLISIRRNLSTEFTAIGIVLVNVIGFILGNLGARLLIFCPPILQHALSTFVVTEFLGWGLNYIAIRLHPRGAGAHDREVSWKKDYGWLIFAAVAVLGVRAIIDYVFSGGMFQENDALHYTYIFLQNGTSLVLMIAASALFVRLGSGHHYPIGYIITATFLFLFVVSIACSVIVTMGVPFNIHEMDMRDFERNILVALVVETTIFSLVYMVNFTINMHREAVSQRNQRHQAEFRYLTLKNHVNPHFLFNSLNVLDSVIKENSKEEASEYVHKLAGVYRYLMLHEENRIVPLSEEERFALMYFDLLKVRFPEGLEIKNDISHEDRTKGVVPCTLQLILENATKHNAISPDNPLLITLHSDGRNLTVSNNIIPRLSPPSSTGLGLKYIRNQYRDLAGAEVIIEKTADSFTITLPLLED